MKKEFYSNIKSRLETKLGDEIKHIALWNSQIDNEQTEKPFRFPALFLEFTNIDFRSETSGVQKCDLEFTIHCCFSQLIDDIDLLDTFQNVASALHLYSDDYFSAITRVSEQMDPDHDRVIDWTITFVCTLTDELTFRENQLTQINTSGTDIGLELTSDLDIDNTVIRSGDGQ